MGPAAHGSRVRKTGDDRFPTSVKKNAFKIMLSHLILRIARYAAPISSELGGLRVCHPSSSFPSAEPREVGDRRSEGRGLRSSFAWPRVRLRRSGAARSPTIVRTRAGFTGYTYSSSRDMMPHLRTRYVHRERNRRVTRTTVAPAAWVLAPARTLEYAAPGLRHTGGFVPGGAGHACGRIRLCLPGGARRAFASLAPRAPGPGPERPTKRGFDARDP